MPAAGALMEMAAECGGATPRNGQQPFDVLAAKIHWRFRSMKAAPALADEIGHLKGAAGSACLQALRDVFVSIGWRHCASGCLERARRWFFSASDASACAVLRPSITSRSTRPLPS